MDNSKTRGTYVSVWGWITVNISIQSLMRAEGSGNHSWESISCVIQLMTNSRTSNISPLCKRKGGNLK